MREETFEDLMNGTANGNAGTPKPVATTKTKTSNGDDDEIVSLNEFDFVPQPDTTHIWELPKIIAPYKGTDETIHFLDGIRLRKKMLHSIWANVPKYFQCEQGDCKLCLANKASVFLVAPIYVRYVDVPGPGFLQLPEKSDYKYSTSEALTTLVAAHKQFGDQLWTVPFEVSMENSVLILKIELSTKGQANTLTAQFPEYKEIDDARQCILPPEYPVFSLELHGQLFPKEAAKIRSKLGAR